MSIRTRASKIAVIALLGASVLTSVPSPVMAQDRANAEELFQLGKAAMTRQELTKACSYFQASLAADFALGTLLNLAICHEQSGKIASAWAEYRTLEDRARRATPPQVDRAQFAHDHAEALRPRLSRVRIVLSPEAAAIPGLVVKVDGVTVAPELFDAGVPVDVGKRTLSASAPDHADWTQAIAVDDERLKLEAKIPALERRAAKPALTAPPSTSAAIAELERVSEERSKRTVGFVVGGIGLASLAAGGVFGLLAVGAADQAKCPPTCYTTNDQRTGPNPVLVDAKDAYDRANVYGWVSNVTFGAGLIGVGVGTYLVLTAGSSSNNKGSDLRASVVPLPNGGALTFAGSL